MAKGNARMKDHVHLHFKIDKLLRDAFEQIVAQQDLNKSIVLRQLVREYVQKNSQKKMF